MSSIFVPCREGPSRCPIPSAPLWPPRHVALCQSRQNRRAEKERARIAAAEPVSRGRPGAGGHGAFGSRASHADFISRSPLPQAMGSRKKLAGRRRRGDSILGAFLIWTARKLLKRPESDEGIQDNPSPFSWSGLVWLGLGLKEFGLGRFARWRRPLAPGAPLKAPRQRTGVETARAPSRPVPPGRLLRSRPRSGRECPPA